MRFERQFGLLVLAFICTICALALPAAAQAPETHAKVELIADPESRVSKGTVWVGLQFSLDPGWHIYWRNSGDSGEPPVVRWTLPAGAKAGPLEWPTPVRLGSGSIVDYGYENEVLLMKPIEIEKGASASSLPIAGDVKYIVCREICIPGKAHVEVEAGTDNALPPAKTAEWAAKFRKAREELPKRLPAGWSCSARQWETGINLRVSGASAVRNAIFFPDEPGVIENSASQKYVASGSGFELRLTKSQQLLDRATKLQGVLVVESLDGTRHSYRVAMPVH
jgi:thiol:disulfide interchange protein DsbD